MPQPVRASLQPELLREFIQRELHIDVTKLLDSTPLISSGLIDSVSVVSLVTFVEQSCGLSIEARDVTLDNFDTIGRIVAFANRP